MSINLSFAISYNSSYTDLKLETNGWCVDNQINFKIYNITDYQNKEKIKNKLCDPKDKCAEYECALEKNYRKDECEECGSCLYFNLIKNPKVTIHDGPIDGSPVLKSITPSNGEFTFTFTKANGYFIEIEMPKNSNDIPNQKYNDYEEMIIVEECGTKTTQKEEEKLYNKSFTYLDSKVLVNITNGKIENSSQISVRDDVILTKQLNNTIKTIGITSKEKNYSNINIKIQVPNIENLKLYKYDGKKNDWSEVNNFKIENEYIILEQGDLGIYSVVGEDKKVEVPQNNSIEENIPNDVNTDTNNNNPTTDEQTTDDIVKETITPPEKNNKKINPLHIGVVVVCVLILGIVFYFKIMKSDNKSKEKKNETAENKPEETSHILTTYEQTYQEASKYIDKYKSQYSKDQIYRALKQSGVPNDVIDKCFTEKF